MDVGQDEVLKILRELTEVRMASEGQARVQREVEGVSKESAYERAGLAGRTSR